MAPQKLNDFITSDETSKIIDKIMEGKNFLLSGGAGSGKTHTLVEVIREIRKKFPTDRIACITYTNVAAEEISERADDEKVHVSTIHEFLWLNIKHFQNEIKSLLVELINSDDHSLFRQFSDKKLEHNHFKNLEKGVQYKEFVKLSEGIISHDELLIVAKKMYEKNPRLSAITKSSFPFIFIDEYQDSNKAIIDIFLDHFKSSPQKHVIGFFGDSMQSIYEKSIENIDAYTQNGSNEVFEVRKQQNRRNPSAIISLANKLRNDGLVQHPSQDPSAPNICEDGNVRAGCAYFLYSENSNLKRVREFLGWDFEDTRSIKELNLTHNLIANKAGFSNLMRIYASDQVLKFVSRIKNHIKDNNININTNGKKFSEVLNELAQGKAGSDLSKVQPTPGMQAYINKHSQEFESALETTYDLISSIYIDKDQLVDDKKNHVEDEGKPGSNRDDLIKHLFKIQNNVRLYNEKKYNKFIKYTDYKITRVSDKIKLHESIEKLSEVDGKTIEEVIEIADKAGIVEIDDRLKNFISKKRYIYDQVVKLNFSEFQNLYAYLEGFTPFSTQHKTKGSEFPNVLVVLDNGGWNSYNFEYLFTERADKASIVKRTRKLFYVCCTRAKRNLAVFFHQPSQAVVNQAIGWFGEENVINLDGL
ncbi:UvrD-helicase domain-containing protein [Microbulbifer sp. ANSA003]|uniref:UvrD-helicase domain-containing protein n=1 Tax=unclassified Microbulbifer TaxID=2619833 RepID=UPI0040395687